MKTTIQFCFSLFIMFFALNTSAQTLQEFGAMNATMKASPSESIRNQATHLESLIFHEHAKIYIERHHLQAVGENSPVSLETDVQSVRMLSEDNPLFNPVELIMIRLNTPDELNFILDLHSLPGFQNLKYVQFLCSFECKPEGIEALFLKNNPAITVFYNISIPN